MKSKFKCYFAYSIPKVTGTTNDDNYAISSTSLAVSDGATMAFNSSIWSRILTQQFIKYPNISLKNLVLKAKRIFGRYHKLFYFNNKSVPWNVIEIYDKGSFASLLGIELLNESRIKITAVGDSIVVLISPEKILSFPFESVSYFPFNPVLLSTNLSSNYFFDEDNCDSIYTKTLKIKDPDNTLILCMTDALGIWFLSGPDYAIGKIQYLLNLKDHSKQNIFFKNLIMEERLNKRMKLDDTTLIVAGIQHE